MAAPFFATVVDGAGVVALIHRHRFGLEATTTHGVEERQCEESVTVVGALGAPRERQPGSGADRRVELETVETAAFSGTYGGSVAPRRVGIGEPFALT